MEQQDRKLGRPLGSPNKVSSEVRKLLASWAETELRNISDLYAMLSPKEKAKFITNILPYVSPRLKEVDMAITSLPEEQIEVMIQKLLSGDY